jgi:hypothetical protein
MAEEEKRLGPRPANDDGPPEALACVKDAQIRFAVAKYERESGSAPLKTPSRACRPEGFDRSGGQSARGAPYRDPF